MLDRLCERLDVPTILDACGVDHGGRLRLPCPVHGGTGPSFSIHEGGNAWTCHSRRCGSGHRRDAVNLFCLLRHGAPLPQLQDKGRALRELCRIAGLPYDPDASRAPAHTVNRWDRIPHLERQALAAIFSDTRRLDSLGKSRLFTSRAAQDAILFLAIARSENQLPATVGDDWPLLDNLKGFCRA